MRLARNAPAVELGASTGLTIPLDGPSRMVKRPTGSGGEPSSPNCGASAGVKARQLIQAMANRGEDPRPYAQSDISFLLLGLLLRGPEQNIEPRSYGRNSVHSADRLAECTACSVVAHGFAAK